MNVKYRYSALHLNEFCNKKDIVYHVYTYLLKPDFIKK